MSASGSCTDGSRLALPGCVRSHVGHLGKSGRTADLASGKRAWQDSSRCNTLDMLNYAWDEGKASSNLRKHGVSFQEGIDGIP